MIPLQTGPAIGPPKHLVSNVVHTDPQSAVKRSCEAMDGRYSGHCRNPGGSTPFQGPTPCVHYCTMPEGKSVNHGRGWYPPLNTLEGLGDTGSPRSSMNTVLVVAAVGVLLFAVGPALLGSFR